MVLQAVAGLYETGVAEYGHFPALPTHRFASPGGALGGGVVVTVVPVCVGTPGAPSVLPGAVCFSVEPFGGHPLSEEVGTVTVFRDLPVSVWVDVEPQPA
jgi:hypothetical protein